MQLAGGKRVQEILTRPGFVEKFLPELSSEDLEELRESWVGMYALDQGKGDESVDKARRDHRSLVLKAQREGGGNNVYKENIPAFLDTLPSKDRKAWIAMELIEPPPMSGLMVKAGSGVAVRGDVVSELGVFGWALFGGDRDVVKRGGVEQGKDVGWLVRTKGRESDEGGVAVGFSVLDSLVLVD